MVFVIKLVTLCAIALASLVGNSYLVYTVLSEEQMKVAANSFVVSQSVADLSLTVLIMPQTAVSLVFDDWVLGHVLCSVEPYLLTGFHAAAQITAAAIAVDRYKDCLGVDYLTFEEGGEGEREGGLGSLVSARICFPADKQCRCFFPVKKKCMRKSLSNICCFCVPGDLFQNVPLPHPPPPTPFNSQIAAPFMVLFPEYLVQ